MTITVEAEELPDHDGLIDEVSGDVIAWPEVVRLRGRRRG